MSAPSGLVSFRPNLLHDYHNPSERVPFRPGVFEGYQVKSWYLPADEEQDDTSIGGDTGSEGDSITE